MATDAPLSFDYVYARFLEVFDRFDKNKVSYLLQALPVRLNVELSVLCRMACFRTRNCTSWRRC